MKLLGVALSFFVSAQALAGTNNGLVYHGRIVAPNGSAVNSGTASFNLQVYGSSTRYWDGSALQTGNTRCLLYQETHSKNMSGSLGAFELILGEGTGAIWGVGATAADQRVSKLFVNNPLDTGNYIKAVSCTQGSGFYFPSGPDVTAPEWVDRELVVTISVNGTSFTLSPVAIKAQPYAMQAQQVGGFSPQNLFRIDGTSNLKFSAAQHDYLARSVSEDGSIMRLFGLPAVPVSATEATSKAYVDAQIASAISGGGGGGVATVTGTAPIQSSGGGNPVISISQASSAIPGYLSAADWVTFNNKLGTATQFAGEVSGAYNNIVINAGVITTAKISDAAVTFAKLQNVTGPALIGRGAAGAGSVSEISVGSGLALSVDGVLTATNTGSVTSVGGIAPIESSGGATPMISISQASNLIPGYLSAADWVTFNNKLSAITGSGLVSVTGGNAVNILMASQALAGRFTAGSGAAEQISIGSGLSLDGAGVLTAPAVGVTSASISNAGGYVQGGNAFGVNASLGTLDNRPLSFIANNTPAMTISQNGNVGIGTSLPTSKLSILSANAGNDFLISDSFGVAKFEVGVTGTLGNDYATLKLYNNDNPSFASLYTYGGSLNVQGVSGGNGILINSNSNTSIRFNTWGTERVRFDAVGNVGIGTTNPSHPLDVIGNGRFSGTLSVGNLTLPGGAITVNGSSSMQDIYLVGPSSNGGSVYGGSVANNSVTIDSTSHPTKGRVLIAPAGGNVAIGATNPSFPLDVRGTIQSAGTATSAGMLRLSEQNTNAGNNFVAFRAAASLSTDTTFTWPSNGGNANQVLTTDGTGNLSWASAGGASGFVNGGNAFGVNASLGTTDNRPLSILTNNTPAMTISQDGNVGIGAASPLAPLHIQKGTNSSIYLGTSTSNAGEHQIGFGFHTFNSYAAAIAGKATGGNGRGVLEFRVAGGGDATNATTSDTVMRLTSSGVEVLQPLTLSLNTLAFGVDHNSGVKALRFSRSENKSGIFSVPVGNNGRADLRFVTGDEANGNVKSEADAVMRITPQGGLVLGNSYLSTEPGAGNAIIRGNVAIGTTNPSYPLDVRGTIQSQGAAAGGTLRLAEAAGTGNNFVALKAADSLSGDTTFTWPSNGGDANQVLTTDGAGVLSWTTASGGASGFVNGGNAFGVNASIGTTDNRPLSILTNNTPAMTISQSGNVGIGTASPSSALHVVGNITSPGSGTNSEKFGLNSTATAPNTVAVGNNAQASYDGGIALGRNSTATADVPTGDPASPIAIGASATANATRGAIALGGATTSSGQHAITIGNGSTTSGNSGITIGPVITNSFSSIAMGRGATPSAANQFIMGGVPGANDLVINALHFGSPSGSSTPNSSVLIQGANGQGTNTIGSELRISAGRSTGSANGGSLSFQTSPAGSSGTAQNSATTRMTIDSSGNVGIGLTAPNRKLYVAESVAGLSYPLKLDNYSSNTSAGTGILFSVDGDGAGALQTGRGKGGLVYVNTLSYNRGDFHFLQNTGATSGTIASMTDSVMVIKNDGKVGIGATNPSFPLDVRGTIQSAGTAASAGMLRLSEQNTNAGNNFVALRAPADLSGDTTFVLPSNGGNANQVLTTDGTGNLTWGSPGGASGFVNGGNAFGVNASIGTTDNRPLSILINNSPAVTISQGGNVGIGIVNPTTKLDVVGVGKFNNIQLGTNGGNTISNSADAIYLSGISGYVRMMDPADYQNGFVFNSIAHSIQAGGPITGNPVDMSLQPLGGNLGVGTSTPQFKLVVGTMSTAANPATSGSTDSSQLARFYATNVGAAGYGLDIGVSNTTGTSWLQARNSNDFSVNAPLLINPNGGNVGIGTSNPSYPLDVRGTIQSAGTSAAPGQVQLSEQNTNVGNNFVALRAPADLSGDTTFVLPTNGGDANQVLTTDGTGNLSWGSPGGASGFVNGGNAFGVNASIGTTDNRPLSILTNNSPAVTISQNGYVGIGTTSPTSTLSINGATDVSPHDVVANWSGTAPTNLTFSATSYGDASRFVMRRANGTQAAPTPVLANNFIGNFNFRGYTSGGSFTTGGVASVVAIASEDFTPTANGTALGFNTTANGTNFLSQRMLITNSGYVGIGTGSPGVRLHVADGSIPDNRIRLTNSGSGGMDLISAGSDSYISTEGTGALILRTNIDNRGIYIGSNGNVGIGATVPAAKLDVVETSIDAKARIFANNPSNGRIAQLELAAANGGDPGTASVIKFSALSAQTNSKLQIRNSVDSVLMSVLNNGNVGIGISSPENKLHIYDNGITNGNLNQLLTLDAGTMNPSVAGSGATIGFRGNGGGYFGAIGGYGTGAGGGPGHGVGIWGAGNSGVPTMMVNDSGNVGIGTTNPSYPLDVVGTGLVISKFVSSNPNPRLRISTSAASISTNTAILDFTSNTSTTERVSNSFLSGFSDTTDATRTSIMNITGIEGGVGLQVMTLAGSKVGIGTTSPTAMLDVNQTTAGSEAIQAQNAGTAFWKVVNPAGGATNTWNTANAVQYVGRDTGTNRSINAAGTINASGADFAEWVDWSGPKPEMGSVVLYRGSYVVVSSPFTAAFIGNDTKDPEHSILIAFAGQLPVLVRGVVNEGDLIVAADDGTAIAVPKAQATVQDAYRAVGTAWASSQDRNLKRIHVAVGIGLAGGQRDIASINEKTKQLETENKAKDKKIKELEQRLEKIEKALAK